VNSDRPFEQARHFACLMAPRRREPFLRRGRGRSPTALLRIAALGLQQTRAADHDHYWMSPRRRDIEPVQAVKKFHSARRILW
jgi:hypothetical protein